MWELLGLINGKVLLVATIVGVVVFLITVPNSKEEDSE